MFKLIRKLSWTLLLFSHAVVSDCLWPRGLQHARLPCPSLFPGVCSNSCPLSWWCHLTISSSYHPHSSSASVFPSIRSFSSESALRIRWPKYWSFSCSINPSIDYSGFCFYFKNQVLTLNPIPSTLQILCSVVFVRILFNIVNTF